METLHERLHDINPPLSLMQEHQNVMVQELTDKKEALIKQTCKDKFGVELTIANADRVKMVYFADEPDNQYLYFDLPDTEINTEILKDRRMNEHFLIMFTMPKPEMKFDGQSYFVTTAIDYRI